MNPRRDFARDPAVVPRTTTTPDLIVPRTILEQLGGRRFAAMTGAKDFLGGPHSLSFKVPQTRAIADRPGRGHPQTRGIRGVRITLTPAKRYTVACYTWGRKRGPQTRLAGGRYGCIDTVATVEDVSAEQLRHVFTQVTGLRTTPHLKGRWAGR